jgi:hypothetical protein
MIFTALATESPTRGRTNVLRRIAAAVVACCALVAACPALAQTFSDHFDPVTGVNRIVDPLYPTGSCGQCHDMHELDAGGAPSARLLFTEDSNNLCYTTGGVGPCHQLMPLNYPATESSRIPDGFPDAGYFEHNAGGVKIHGVDVRSRWTGQTLYDNPAMILGHYISPHANDPDMPRIDASGKGMCVNCHTPHDSTNPFDQLLSAYRGTGGFDEPTYPTRYQACFDCHSAFGPPGMDPASRLIQDFYDSSINSDGYAGHQINKNPAIAISWPSHIQVGDKLGCYNCHNPHGSQGYNGLGANAYLISDQRPEWENLTDTLNDDAQNRKFCLGCHINSDGVPGSKTVDGIVMNALPAKNPHLTSNTKACSDCHGGSYSSSTQNNVHHPAGKGN